LAYGARGEQAPGRPELPPLAWLVDWLRAGFLRGNVTLLPPKAYKKGNIFVAFV